MPNGFNRNKHANPRFYLNAAKSDPDCDIRNSGSSHYIVTKHFPGGHDESMCVSDHGELGEGLACKIFKWFVKAGIICGAVALLGYLVVTFC
jgi:hypothetical protein